MVQLVDAGDWRFVDLSQIMRIEEGLIRVRCSRQCLFMAQPVGVAGAAVPLGVGYEFAFQFSRPHHVFLEPVVEGAFSAWLYDPPPQSYEPAEDETFTNIDRMPDDSGSHLEVTRALRLFEIEKRALLAQIRAEANEASGGEIAEPLARDDLGAGEGDSLAPDGEGAGDPPPAGGSL